MRFSIAITAVLLFAEQVLSVQGLGRIFAKPIIDVSKAYRYKAYIDQKVRRDAHNILNHELYHQRNVIPSTPVALAAQVAPKPTEPAAPIDANKWNTETEAACQDAFSKINDSQTNPSGMAACYNIRYFNNSTGSFQASLRLYRMAPATGDWAALDANGLSIGISCSGASLAVGKSAKGKRHEKLPPIRAARSQTITMKRSIIPSPKMLQDLTFVGKIHENQMGEVNDYLSARSLLVPTIALSGTSKEGNPITTKISPNNTSFVSGVFADVNTKTSTTSPTPTPPSRAAAQAPHFVMPGRTLGIFPVGFIITSVWAFLFVAVVGAGTVDRIRFREAYRRRVKREMSVGLRMI